MRRKVRPGVVLTVDLVHTAQPAAGRHGHELGHQYPASCRVDVLVDLQHTVDMLDDEIGLVWYLVALVAGLQVLGALPRAHQVADLLDSGGIRGRAQVLSGRAGLGVPEQPLLVAQGAGADSTGGGADERDDDGLEQAAGVLGVLLDVGSGHEAVQYRCNRHREVVIIGELGDRFSVEGGRNALYRSA